MTGSPALDRLGLHWKRFVTGQGGCILMCEGL